MTPNRKTKSALLLGCGQVAIASGAMFLPAAVHAEAFQALPSVVQGTVNIDRSVVGEDTITVTGMDAVVDWDPYLDEFTGNAMTFLPAGNTGIFQGAPGDTNFAIINRILPDSAGTIAVMDGNVISQLQDISGAPLGPGGFVMFYSPTGILVGSTASFDIGSLVLTSLAPDINNLSAYASGSGSMNFVAAQADSPPVTINSGATIKGTEEGSSFLIAAPSIAMGGVVDINGSTAYVAGEDVTLSYANGLFDIVINTGSNAATAITHTGTTGGPASTGAGDNHVIYGVMQTQQAPGSAIFQGNLGFQPAANATIENGAIILSANYDVLGTTVQNDFTQSAVTNSQSVQLLVEGANISSDIEMHSSDLARIAGNNSSVNITGDVFLYARNSAGLFSLGDSLVQITGDVVVSANDVGNSVSGVSSISELMASAGTASVGASLTGSIEITGNLTVQANATPGLDLASMIHGSASAGTVNLYSDEAFFSVSGDILASASATRLGNDVLNSGGDMFGGTVGIDVINGAFFTVQGDLQVGASGIQRILTGPGDGSSAGDGFGGSATLFADTSATIDIGGLLSLDSLARGADTRSSTDGGNGISGFAQLVLQGGSQLTANQLQIGSSGFGGSSTGGGNGGAAFSGTAEVLVFDTSALTVDGLVVIIGTNAEGGDGANGGDAFAGSSILDVRGGTVNFAGDLVLGSQGLAGDGIDGFGGSGGDGFGGLTEVNVGIDENVPSNLSVLGRIGLFSNGTGGNGGAGDGLQFGGGDGGDGFGGYTDSTNEIFGGALINVMADSGTLATSGILVFADGQGGNGGDNGDLAANLPGGNGGDGFGGTALAGMFLKLGSGSVLAGSADFGATQDISANGFGGDGGQGTLNGAADNGMGGSGTGGDSSLIAEAGGILGGEALIYALGSGGNGGIGGNGTGGFANIQLDPATTLDITGTSIVSGSAVGGDGLTMAGAASAGTAGLTADAASLTGDILLIAAEALPGTGASPTSGDVIGGTAQFQLLNNADASLTELELNARASALAGGSASGGSAEIDLQGAGTTLDTGITTLIASASGGTTNISGIFAVSLDNASFSTSELQATALNSDGVIESSLSSISVLGGSLNIANSMLVDISGNLQIETGLGGLLLGGPDPLNLTASFDITAGGLVTIAGDDDATTSFLAQFMTITSNDLDVLAGARFGAPTLSLYSTNVTDGTILGGTTAGDGYTLTQAEFDRIEGDDLFIQAADTAGAVPYSLELRDLTIPGSSVGGFSQVGLDSIGSFGVVGNVLFTDAGASNALFLGALQEMEFVLPNASVMMVDSGGTTLAGSLSLFAPQIFAGDSATLATINSNPDDPALATLLGDDGANSTLSNYIGADTVDISGGSHILMQNSGAAGTMAGIIVGPGGLTIRQSPDLGASSTMRTVAYGMQDLGSGGTVTNENWFALVDFGPDPSVEFTAEATFNDCIIVTGFCAYAPPPPPPPPPGPPEIETPVTTIVYTELPPTKTNLEPSEQPFILNYFGSWFPSLLSPPSVGGRGLVTDPVTSGGDAAAYSQDGNVESGS